MSEFLYNAKVLIVGGLTMGWFVLVALAYRDCYKRKRQRGIDPPSENCKRNYIP